MLYLQAVCGFKIEDFELIELNEAFAARYIGCERELGLNREIQMLTGLE